MDLKQMIMDKIRRENLRQGDAARQMSEFYLISRATLNRFLNHEEIQNPRKLIAIAKWVGLTDRESQLELLELHGFLSGKDISTEKRHSLQYQLNAIEKELRAVRSALEAGQP